MNTAGPGDHNEEGKQATGGGFPYLKVGGIVLFTIVVVFGVRAVWGYFFPSPSTKDTQNTAAFEASVKGWITAAEDRVQKQITGLDEKINSTSNTASQTLERELKVRDGQLGTIRADTSSLKEEQGKLAKTGLEHEKALGVLTANLNTLTEQIAALKAVPPQPVVPVVPQQVTAVPAVASAVPVASTTGLPPTNVSTASGPGPRAFNSAVTQSDTSLSTALRRMASQEKVYPDAALAMETAARALDAGVKVDPQTGLRLKAIALGLEKAKLHRDATVVREALALVQ